MLRRCKKLSTHSVKSRVSIHCICIDHMVHILYRSRRIHKSFYLRHEICCSSVLLSVHEYPVNVHSKIGVLLLGNDHYTNQ